MIYNFITTILLQLFMAWGALANNVLNSELKEGFVYLNKIDPSIIVKIRYSDSENIIKNRLQGCYGQDAVLTKEAAEALQEVQEDLVMRGFSLVVYNAYYPQKAYQDLVSGLKNLADRGNVKDSYYPNLQKTDLASLSYIKDKADHIRGSTVDVTIIPLKNKIKLSPNPQKKTYKGRRNLIYLNDGTVDMGSSYDCFDEISGHDYQYISNEAKNNRQLLKEIMQNHGFIANRNVWWQYTLAREPYIDSNFDFDL